MVAPTPFDVRYSSVPSSSIEYYFDISIDQDINQEQACKAALAFNRSSYYVDIDFECDMDQQDSVYFDIYGSQVEPEICLD